MLSLWAIRIAHMVDGIDMTMEMDMFNCFGNVSDGRDVVSFGAL